MPTTAAPPSSPPDDAPSASKKRDELIERYGLEFERARWERLFALVEGPGIPMDKWEELELDDQFVLEDYIEYMDIFAPADYRWPEEIDEYLRDLDGVPAGFITLGDLLANPALLEPPAVVVPGLAWEGRLTVIAAREKIGKSTLTGHAAAVVSNGGRFLGEHRIVAGRVAWVGLEEFIGDAARRFESNGADHKNVLLVHGADDTKLLSQVRALASHTNKPRLIVIDSLTEWARRVYGRVPEEGSSKEWAAVVRPLAEIAHAHNVAVVIIHHARKSDGSYRGSTEIGAAADVILEMAAVGGEDSRTRRVKGKGRVEVEPWTWNLPEGGGTPQGGSGAAPLDVQVYDAVKSSPGIGRKDLYKAVGGTESKVKAALDPMIADGRIEERPEPQPGQTGPAPKRLYVGVPFAALAMAAEELK